MEEQMPSNTHGSVRVVLRLRDTFRNESFIVVLISY
jgi:hypothetical protein